MPRVRNPPPNAAALDGFARKLNALLLDKQLSQSDLARAVWGTQTDARGYQVARNRDRISAYLRGTSIPEPANLKKIADVLGTTVQELAPDITASAVDRDRPALALHVAQGHPDKVHLTVNQLVPLAVATEIMKLLTGMKDPAT